MHRLRAASCLPLAFIAFTAPCLFAEHLRIEVMQTHTAVRMGDSPAGGSPPSAAASNCTGSSGVYSREYGFWCADASTPADHDTGSRRAGYEFFFDVDVVMPDQAHVVLHCSSFLDAKCEGFPAYPEATSITCSDFVSGGALYKDCTALGRSPDGIGVYEAALHGDHVTIFGDTWKRDYVHYGSWQATTPPPAQDPAALTPNSSAAELKEEEPPIDPEIIIQAKAGDAVAQYKLGYDYYLGKGISQDYAQAAIWWQKAAEQGYADAQNNLGVLYNSGKGVPQSYSEAYFWQNLAAARSNGQMQAQFAKNRDDSAAKLSMFERLRVQHRASQWAAKHPIQLQQKDSAAPGSLPETKPAPAAGPGTAAPDHPKPDQTAPDAAKPPSA